MRNIQTFRPERKLNAKTLLSCKSFSLQSPSKCGHLHSHFLSMANAIVVKIAYYFRLVGVRENLTTEGLVEKHDVSPRIVYSEHLFIEIWMSF